MTYHLPECLSVVATRYGNDFCICDRLRACEARVTERKRSVLLIADAYGKGLDAGYDAALVKERKRSVLLIADAYGKGLDAARDTVAALLDSWHWGGGFYPRTAILAAIEALKGEQK